MRPMTSSGFIQAEMMMMKLSKVTMNEGNSRTCGLAGKSHQQITSRAADDDIMKFFKVSILTMTGIIDS